MTRLSSVAPFVAPFIARLVAPLALATAVVACSSDGPNFGPEKDPTPAQQTAFTATAQQLGALASAGTQGQAAGQAAISLAVGAQAMTSTSAALPPGAPTIEEVARHLVIGASAIGDCGVVSSDRVVWTRCTDGSGYTIDGSISWSANHVAMDVHVDANLGGTQLTYAFTGSVSTSPGAITMDMSVAANITSGTTKLDVNLHANADVHVTDGCVTSGTYTVTASTSGASSRNAAVQIVWTGCNAFRVRTSA